MSKSFRNLMVTTLAALVATPAFAGPDQDAVDIATAMASCGGLFAALAEVEQAMDKPASAEHFRGLSRGWELGAQYVMAIEAGARGLNRTFGSFENFTQPIAETESTRILAMVENRDMTGMQQATEACQEPELVRFQEDIINELRTREK